MEIKICKKCKGEGWINNYTHSQLEDSPVKCNNCNGTGKIRSTVMSFELKIPSNLSPKILYNANDELWEVYEKYDKIIKDNTINKSKTLFDN